MGQDGIVEQMYVCVRAGSRGQHVFSGVTLKDAIFHGPGIHLLG